MQIMATLSLACQSCSMMITAQSMQMAAHAIQIAGAKLWKRLQCKVAFGAGAGGRHSARCKRRVPLWQLVSFVSVVISNP